MKAMAGVFVVLAGMAHTGSTAGAAVATAPGTVSFDSADGKVKLSGYLYLPDARAWPGPRPAIVLLHGRSGLHRAGASRFDAATLGSRTTLWGNFWADRGYIGLYVDSFGPRGFPRGFEAGTNRNGGRPAEVNEITVRPHDANMALQFFCQRGDVRKDQVFLQGWSNGGSATLSAMATNTLVMDKPTFSSGFRAAIAVYPACNMVARRYGEDYRPYAPLLLLIGTDDEEVSYARCEQLAAASRDAGGDLEFVRYPGAQHSYDTPTAKRQGLAANTEAAADTKVRAETFFGRFIQPAKSSAK